MNFKTGFIVALTAIVAIGFFQNIEPVEVDFLFWNFKISMLLMIGIVFVLGLIVGLLWGSGKQLVAPSTTSALSEEDRKFVE
jgi:uncharacterized integral membrane protein